MSWSYHTGAVVLAVWTTSCSFRGHDAGSGECGNGVIDGHEVCDGAEIDEESCSSKGFQRGTLGCAADCLAFDTSACSSEIVRRGDADVFTFLFWTDQEIDNDDGDANFARLAPAVEAMGSMAGRAYPEVIGGTVAAPDFIASGGDSAAWPTSFCVDTVWDQIVHDWLALPTRAVAGNHDSGGGFSSNRFYDWLRADPFIAEHTSDNGQPAWSLAAPEPIDDEVTASGIIPGINYSFRHKGVVFVMWSPTYHLLDAAPGYSYLSEHDLSWLETELREYDRLDPKVVVCHYNGGSIMNRGELDLLYAEHNVLLQLSGHWEAVQHWQAPATDYVMDAGCRGEPANPSVSVVRFDRDRLTLAHYEVGTASWHDLVIDRSIPMRWSLEVFIAVQPENQVVEEGQSATFAVEAEGEPPLAYQWQVNAGDGWEMIADAEQRSYTTPELSRAETGPRYRCLVSNSLPSQAASDPATATVTPAP